MRPRVAAPPLAPEQVVPVEDAPDIEAAVAATVPDQVMALLRQILSEGAYVGHSAFMMFAMRFGRRPFVWEGENRKDLLDFYMPWAKETCTEGCGVDGVACVLDPDGDLFGEWTREALKPVSPENPLHEVRHWVAAVAVGGACFEGADPLNKFYGPLGQWIVGTVCDGNCGIDLMAMMLERPQNAETRKWIREELYEFGVRRWDEPWFHDLLVVTQELRLEAVQAYRSCGGSGPPGPIVVDDAGGEGEPTVAPKVPGAPGPLLMKALMWQTGVQEHGILFAMAAAMPEALQQEQIRAHALACAHPHPAAQPEKRTVCPHLLKNRELVCRELDKYARSCGWPGVGRLPDKTLASFCGRFDWPKDMGLARQHQAVAKWWCTWRKAGGVATLGGGARRRARGTQGKPTKAPWLEAALYEWWSHMRYSVNWKAVAKRTPDREQKPKMLARFSQSLLLTKAKQLVAEYCVESMKRGIKPKVPQLRPRWWTKWRRSHGLSMRKPNRKYKIPKWLLQSRFETMVLNVARVRAAAEELLGYDPHILNWDQSPFHHNESSSATKTVLAVKGGIVPLVEAHDDSRNRWTANLTVSSDVEDIRSCGAPPAELMFKGGPVVAEKLAAHARGSGFPRWVSTATSEKGSYRADDVISFLRRHLREWPDDPQLRGKWRVLMADDHSPHKADAVRRLAWQRGYVLIIHGGGTTAVAQPVDTDLNQHVKRLYIALETQALCQQMALGKHVPQLRREECAALMVSVLSNVQLHVDAAQGFRKTGIRAPFDKSGDLEICREAAELWEAGGLRAKVDAAVAEVREECRKGRLKWTYNDVKLLIHEYEQNKEADAVLQRLGDEVLGPEPGHEDGAEGCEESEGEEEESEEEDEEHEDASWGDALAENSAGAVADDGLGEAEVPVDSVAVDAQTAEQVAVATSVAETLREVEEMLRNVGMEKMAQHCRAAQHKQKKRLRELAREDDDLLRALTAQRDHEAAVAAKRRRLAKDANDRTKALHDLKKQIREAESALREKKEAAVAVEAALANKHALAQWKPEEFKVKKSRMAALDRLARGTGVLSDEQRGEWAWFKTHWDEAMCKEHKEQWPFTFPEWLQRVANDAASGDRSALSKFVHSETVRTLGGQMALVIPAIVSAGRSCGPKGSPA